MLATTDATDFNRIFFQLFILYKHAI